MLDVVLKEFEFAAVAVVQAQLGGMLAEVTRRRSSFAPPVSPWFAWNIAVRPAEATGHPHSDFEAIAEVSLQTFGRDTNGTRCQDTVRFLSDLAFERAMAAPAVARLFTQPENWSYEIDIKIDEGTTVYLETILGRMKRRDIFAAGTPEGIVERFAADGVGSGAARGALGACVVHAVGLDALLVPGEALSALFAGCAGDSSESLELRAQGAGVPFAAQPVTSPAGSLVFDTTGITPDVYTLRIVDGLTLLAESLPIRIIAAP